MSKYESIIVEKKEQVDWVTLNRPESLNAITTPMVSELRDYFGSLMENQSTRIVVLRGAGRGFCAGLDIKASQAKTHEQPFAGGMGFQGYLCRRIHSHAPMSSANYIPYSWASMRGRLLFCFSIRHSYCRRKCEDECSLYSNRIVCV